MSEEPSVKNEEEINNSKKNESWLLKTIKVFGMEVSYSMFMGIMIGFVLTYAFFLSQPELILNPVISIAVRATMAAQATEVKYSQTPVLAVTETPVPTKIATITPTLTKIGTVEATITNTATAKSPTPTSTPVTLLEELFLNNSNGWILEKTKNNDVTTETKIFGGVFINSIINNDASAFEHWNNIPHAQAQDFCIAFDGKISEMSNKTSTAIGLRYRMANNDYYLVRFFSNGSYKAYIVYDGKWEILQDTTFSSAIKQSVGAVNNFKICVEGALAACRREHFFYKSTPLLPAFRLKKGINAPLLFEKQPEIGW